MPSDVQIKKDVLGIYERLAEALGLDTSNISQATRLWVDLRLAPAVREEMARPLSQYSELHGGGRVLRSDAKGFKTIGKASAKLIDLIP